MSRLVLEGRGVVQESVSNLTQKVIFNRLHIKVARAFQLPRICTEFSLAAAAIVVGDVGNLLE